MNMFDREEQRYIFYSILKLGLHDLADDFRKHGLVRVFDTRTGRSSPLSDLDILHIEDVKEIFGSRTFLIISAFDTREGVGKVDFFLGIGDEGCNYTNLIFVEPEVGAISSPALFPNREFQYSIESFVFSKTTESDSWDTITSLHESLEDDNNLPF